MHDQWTTVATFHDTSAAAVAKNFLDNEGIPSILLDEATVATDWMLSTAIGGIKLQVAPHHIERAEGRSNYSSNKARETAGRNGKRPGFSSTPAQRVLTTATVPSQKDSSRQGPPSWDPGRSSSGEQRSMSTHLKIT